MAVPTTVVKSTVTGVTGLADRVTVNDIGVVPVSPSVIEASLIDRVGGKTASDATPNSISPTGIGLLLPYTRTSSPATSATLGWNCKLPALIDWKVWVKRSCSEGPGGVASAR